MFVCFWFRCQFVRAGWWIWPGRREVLILTVSSQAAAAQRSDAHSHRDRHTQTFTQKLWINQDNKRFGPVCYQEPVKIFTVLILIKQIVILTPHWTKPGVVRELKTLSGLRCCFSFICKNEIKTVISFSLFYYRHLLWPLYKHQPVSVIPLSSRVDHKDADEDSDRLLDSPMAPPSSWHQRSHPGVCSSSPSSAPHPHKLWFTGPDIIQFLRVSLVSHLNLSLS